MHVCSFRCLAILSSVACLLCNIFPRYLIHGRTFGGGGGGTSLNMKCVCLFSLQRLHEKFKNNGKQWCRLLSFYVKRDCNRARCHETDTLSIPCHKHLCAKSHENPTKGAGVNAASQVDGRGLTHKVALFSFVKNSLLSSGGVT